MNVKQLIAELKKMPQDLNVGLSASDNSEHEISDWVNSVKIWDKEDIECPSYIDHNDKECFSNLPARCVVIRG